MKLPTLADFAEKFFHLNGQPLKLDYNQRAAINAIEFGYDIEDDFMYEYYQHVDAAPPKRIIMKWPRQYGKTTTFAVAAAAMLCLMPEVNIGTTSLNEDGAKDLKKRVVSLIRSNSITEGLIKSENALEILMKNGSFLQCNPQTEGIRGRTYNYLFIDEAAKYDESILTGAILYTATRAGERVILLSTPFGSSNYFGRNFKTAVRTRPVVCSHCFSYFPQETFNNATFSLLEMPQDLRDCPECGKNEWKYGVGEFTVIPVDPWNCSFQSPDEIRRKLDQEKWSPIARQEILGDFIDDVATLFRNEWIDEAVNPQNTNVIPRSPNTYFMGVDFGKYHDASSFVITHREDERVVMDYIYTLSSSIRKFEYGDVRDDLFRIIRDAGVSHLVLDATGVGDPVIEEIRRHILEYNVPVTLLSNKNNRYGFVFTLKSKEELITNLVRLFEAGKLELPSKASSEVRALIDELISFGYEITQTNVKYGTQDSHDDRVIALALSCWGATNHSWTPAVPVLGGQRGGIRIDRQENLSNEGIIGPATSSHWTSR